MLTTLVVQMIVHAYLYVSAYVCIGLLVCLSQEYPESSSITTTVTPTSGNRVRKFQVNVNSVSECVNSFSNLLAWQC